MFVSKVHVWARLFVAASTASSIPDDHGRLNGIQSRSELQYTGDSPRLQYGETQTSRTIYTVVSLVCILLLSGMMGT